MEDIQKFTEDQLAERNLQDHYKYEDLPWYWKGNTTEEVCNSVGYEVFDLLIENNIYADITVSGTLPTPIPVDIAFGYTYLTGNENYRGASYLHLGGGSSYSSAPLSLSTSAGVVHNAEYAKDFSLHFISASGNAFLGAEHARWPPISDEEYRLLNDYANSISPILGDVTSVLKPLVGEELVSSKGFIYSTTPSIGMRYDRYWLIDYTDMTKR